MERFPSSSSLISTSSYLSFESSSPYSSDSNQDHDQTMSSPLRYQLRTESPPYSPQDEDFPDNIFQPGHDARPPPASLFIPPLRMLHSREIQADGFYDSRAASSTGFIHGTTPLYKYGGPVRHVRNERGEEFDVIVCTFRMCAYCFAPWEKDLERRHTKAAEAENDRRILDEGRRERPFEGMGFVHWKRDLYNSGEGWLFNPQGNWIGHGTVPSRGIRMNVVFDDSSQQLNGTRGIREVLACDVKSCGVCSGTEAAQPAQTPSKLGEDQITPRKEDAVTPRKKEADPVTPRNRNLARSSPYKRKASDAAFDGDDDMEDNIVVKPRMLRKGG